MSQENSEAKEYSSIIGTVLKSLVITTSVYTAQERIFLIGKSYIEAYEMNFKCCKLFTIKC